MTQKKNENKQDRKWSTGAKVGAAAVGSAALVAALLYANKKRKEGAPSTKGTPRNRKSKK